jgi:chloramphenicol-sensitive protein RarD
LSQDRTDNTAVFAAFFCYLFWGFVPLVFQKIGGLGVGAWETLAERTIWSAPSALVFVLMARQWPQVKEMVRRPKVLAWLTLSALLIGSNWVIFIWAVNSGRVLEASLGYYITPLINMAAGAAIFRERIDRIGKTAMAVAVAGVLLQAFALGHLPIVSLTLATSFGIYAVVRKQIAADAQTGLFIEASILAVPGLALVLWLQSQGVGHFGRSWETSFWLMSSGPITALPLVLFSWAARRIPLSMMGFLQFIGPTIGFGIGLAQGEAFTPLRALSFAFIWSGAVLFMYGAWRRARLVRQAVAEPI